MKIATLQFAPRLGDVEGNIRRADDLLIRGKDGLRLESMRPEVLVLPELAFSGYNFPSLEAIKPFLEPQRTGPTAKWAQETAKRLKCKVCVGYPEIESTASSSSSSLEHGDSNSSSGDKYFNSLLVVDENGSILHNYRKRFLYYTDETWASEGEAERSFYTFNFDRENNPSEQNKIQATFGICMDINPYKFEVPFTDWEFANRVIDSRSPLVIISMAWLTLLDKEELAALSDQPDMDTFQYWIKRFWPLLEKKMEHDGDVDGDTTGSAKKVIIVFANRAGEEPGAEGKDPVRYAGTSAVVAVTQKPNPSSAGASSASDFDVKILCWDIMGAAEEGLCFADTKADPKLVFGMAPRSDSD
ncbi:actin cytoskeleton and mitosis protein [Paecilomyces lecythidis]